MEDLSRKINELLGDPQMMEQIKGLAGLLGQSQEQPKPEPQNNISPLGSAVDPNMLGTLMKIAPLLQSAGGEDDSTRLLKALKPFLKGDRADRIDSAIRMMGFMKMLPLLKNSGINLF